jgi:Arc/MetJ-type ribon-helix-helix transcriptional regulator
LYYEDDMPVNVRLSARTERMLDALAKRRRQTRSDVVREAIEQYAAGHDTDAAGEGPYARWADVIGVVRLGARDPSRTTGDAFAAVVGEKHARRSR